MDQKTNWRALVREIIIVSECIYSIVDISYRIKKTKDGESARQSIPTHRSEQVIQMPAI